MAEIIGKLDQNMITGVKNMYKSEAKSSPVSTRKELNGNQTNGNTIPYSTGDTADVDNLDSSEAVRIARNIGYDFIRYKVGLTKDNPSSLHAETLRRVGDEIEERYAISLSGIVNTLQYDPDSDGRAAFYTSLNTMFEEGPCSWGRVVMVYVFAARIAKYCHEQNRDECVEELITYTGDFVANKLAPWIQRQGGWDDFCEKFKAKDWKEKTAFNSLLLTGIVLGGLATLRFFTK